MTCLGGPDDDRVILLGSRTHEKRIKMRTKELMTKLINGAFQRHELILPICDSDIEDEFSTQTYTLSNGRVIYSKGHDHIIDAVRCAMLVREELSRKTDVDDFEVITPRLKPVWTDPVFW